MTEILTIGSMIVYGFGLWVIWKHRYIIGEAVSAFIVLILLVYFLGKIF